MLTLLMTGHFDYYVSISEGDIKVNGYQYRWLAAGYDLEIRYL